MPLFMVKKEYFDFLRNGRKNIEVRKPKGNWSKSKEGDIAVIQTGRQFLRKTIKRVFVGSLEDILREYSYTIIFPNCRTKEEAIEKMRGMYPLEETFMAFEFH